jgi:glucose/arabinose dehydrogenase
MAPRAAFHALIFVAALTSPAAAQFRGEVIVRGLVGPVAAVADPTDRTVLLIVEQRGVIRVARNGALLDQPFLDLRNDVRSGGEQGLLGLALAPDYAESGRLFVNFTNRDGDTVVARFRRHADDPLQADRASRFDLVWPDTRRVIDQPFDNHNGGHLAFGPDDYLYIGLGDGGSAGDPMNRAQNPQTLLGKMLRIDVGVADDDPRGYRVPEDNPFIDGDPIGALPEIWDFGLRNPWRYSFDDWTRGGTSALVIADVGQNAREEINFEPAGRGGRNYGWRLREGRQAFNANTAAAFRPFIEPIHDYGRTVGASITGGLVYRGLALDPSFNGRYFYADYVSGRVFSIGLHLDPLGEGSADDEREHTERLGRTTVGNVSSFAQDHDGELLLLNHAGGTVVKVVPDFSVVPGAPVAAAVPDRGAGGGLVITWVQPEGAAVVAYAVEQIEDGRVVNRHLVERPFWVVDSLSSCVRIRAVGRTGFSGPASASVCARQ